MPVDDDLLDAKIIECEIKFNETSIFRRNLDILITRGKNIKLVDAPDPTKDAPQRTKKELPMDKVLDILYTDARRQKEYDKFMNESSVFLA